MRTRKFSSNGSLRSRGSRFTSSDSVVGDLVNKSMSFGKEDAALDADRLNNNTPIESSSLSSEEEEPEPVEVILVEKSILTELVQTELLLWIAAVSFLYSFAWRKRRRYLLFNIFILIPTFLWITGFLSCCVVTFVVGGRLFWWLKRILSSKSVRRPSSVEFTPTPEETQKVNCF